MRGSCKMCQKMGKKEEKLLISLCGLDAGWVSSTLLSSPIAGQTTHPWCSDTTQFDQTV